MGRAESSTPGHGFPIEGDMVLVPTHIDSWTMMNDLANWTMAKKEQDWEVWGRDMYTYLWR